MTPNELIYFGSWFTALHKNQIFQRKLLQSFLIFVEKGYFG